VRLTTEHRGSDSAVILLRKSAVASIFRVAAEFRCVINQTSGSVTLSDAATALSPNDTVYDRSAIAGSAIHLVEEVEDCFSRRSDFGGVSEDHRRTVLNWA
jgi:hypothetical protein